MSRVPPSGASALAWATGLLCLVVLPGCETLGSALVSVGAGLGASHQIGGIGYRTFTAPLPKVRNAMRTGLQRMQINIVATDQTATGEMVQARAADRNLEIELETVTPSVTRMRAVARMDNGILVDAATAQEVIVQTGKALAEEAVDAPAAVELSPKTE